MMTAETDGLFRLLQEIETDLAAMRHEERQHVRTLERASGRVKAILTLFRTMERGAEMGSNVGAGKLLPPPSAMRPAPEQIRRFLQCARFVVSQSPANLASLLALKAQGLSATAIAKVARRRAGERLSGA
jgi:hypothetical protein